jgi:hypothetical protein
MKQDTINFKELLEILGINKETDMKPKQNRLANQAKYKGKVILVDLDNTLCIGEAWTAQDCISMLPNTKVINKVHKLYQTNFIVIYTARRDKLIPATLQWLRQNNVLYHAISNIKCSADIYVDDKCIRPEEL